MAKNTVVAGKTSKIVHIKVLDSSVATGAGLTGLAFNTSGLVAYYQRDKDASAVAITLATMTIGTWATGGFKEVSSANMPGVYQLGVPNAAFASGAESVVISLKGATNMAQTDLEIEIVAYDPQNATSLGLADLDAAISSRSTYAGGDTSGTTTLLGRLTSGRGTNLDNLDAAVSSRSTYAGADTAGTTTLLSRIASALTITTGKVDINDKTGFSLSAAGILAFWNQLTSDAGIVSSSFAKLFKDTLDAAISSRSTYGGSDTSGTTTLLSRLTSGRATNLDNLDATISSRLASASYTAPPTVAAIVAGVWDELTATVRTAGSYGAKLKAWALGSDSKVLLSTDSQAGVTIPTVTTLTNPVTTSDFSSNAGTAIAEIQTDIDSTIGALATLQASATEIQSDTDATLTNLATAQTAITEIQGDTDSTIAAVAAVQATANSINSGVGTINTKIGTPVATVSTDIAGLKTDLDAGVSLTLTERNAVRGVIQSGTIQSPGSGIATNSVKISGTPDPSWEGAFIHFPATGETLTIIDSLSQTIQLDKGLRDAVVTGAAYEILAGNYPAVDASLAVTTTDHAAVVEIGTDVDNIETLIGTPAGASVSADLAAIKVDTGETSIDADAIEAAVTSIVPPDNATIAIINTKLGTPASSVSADIAAVKAETADIDAQVDSITAVIASAGGVLVVDPNFVASTGGFSLKLGFDYIGANVFTANITGGPNLNGASCSLVHPDTQAAYPFTVTVTAHTPTSPQVVTFGVHASELQGSLAGTPGTYPYQLKVVMPDGSVPPPPIDAEFTVS